MANAKFNHRYDLVPISVLSTIFLYPSHAFASDPSPLYWFVIVGLVIIGAVFFAVSLLFILKFSGSVYLKAGASGFSFGLFLGPAYSASGSFMPNLANLFTSIGGEGLLTAIAYAAFYAVLFLCLYFVKIKIL